MARQDDARIFANSSLNETMRNGTSKCEKATVPSEDQVPICIIVDPAYPFLPFLMNKQTVVKPLTKNFLAFGYHQQEW